MKIDGVSWSALQKETIISTTQTSEEYKEFAEYHERRFGNQKRSPYSYQILKTKSGKQFVITQCLGEPQLAEITK